MQGHAGLTRRRRILYKKGAPGDMELVILILILLAGMAIAAYLYRSRWKKPTLEEVRLHYGERILFDNDECSIEIRGGAGAGALEKIFIRVTDKRIIIGQRVDSRIRKHVLKYIIYYAEPPVPIKTGPLVFKTDPGRLSIREGSMLRIEPLPGQGAAVPECLDVKNANMEDCRGAFCV